MGFYIKEVRLKNLDVLEQENTNTNQWSIPELNPDRNGVKNQGPTPFD